jgi:uncharacterized protein YdeI (YjbR/CyaY-like superfamily)
MAKAELSELLVQDAQAWHDWLDACHDTSPGVWLVLHKKGGTVTSLTYDAALDEALCFGWIDGQVGKRDGESYRQRMTPRGPRSMWSARNVEHIARLKAEGRIRPAGQAVVQAAQSDGRWDRAYQGQATAQVPADLAAAIAADPAAQAMFDVLTRTNRYALIHRLNAVRSEQTRARKVAEFVAMLARHQTPYPQKRMPG